jgi:hypothetical protein
VSRPPTKDVIDALTAAGGEVRPLAPPLWRALATLGVLALLFSVAIYFLSDVRQLLSRYAGREGLMALEMTAMLATAALAVVGAFFVSIPGRSRRWLIAPLPTFFLWLLLSGIGCFDALLRGDAGAFQIGHSLDCLVFIVAASLVVGVPLIWRLSRATPIDPLPVALLGGLGAAALAAFLLQFFHPFAVTFIDLAVHLISVLLVVATAGMLNRRTLSPA